MTDGTPKVRGRRRLKPDERRAELLGVAEDLVRTGGLEALTMDELASRAGVNRALPYHYFGNWDGVVSTLQEQAFADFRAEVDVEMERHDEPLERLRVLLRWWLDTATPIRAYLAEFDKARFVEPLDAQLTRQGIESAIAVAQLFAEIEPVDDSIALVVASTILDGSSGFIATWRLYDWSIERAIDICCAMIIGALRDASAV